jgi:hypothetical protein
MKYLFSFIFLFSLISFPVSYSYAQIRGGGRIIDRVDRTYITDSMVSDDCVDFTARYNAIGIYSVSPGETGTYSDGEGYNINTFNLLDLDSVDYTAEWVKLESNPSFTIVISDSVTTLTEPNASFQAYSYGFPQVWFNSFDEASLWSAYSPLVGNEVTVHIYSNDSMCGGGPPPPSTVTFDLSLPFSQTLMFYLFAPFIALFIYVMFKMFDHFKW